MEIAREINDEVGISRGLNNVAAVYGNKGEFNNFESYIREAVKINKQIGRKLWEGINYLNLGVINRDTKNYDTAYGAILSLIRAMGFSRRNHESVAHAMVITRAIVVLNQR